MGYIPIYLCISLIHGEKKKDLAGAWGLVAPTSLWGRDKIQQCREKHLSLIRSLLVSSGSNVGSFETLAAIKEKIYRSSTKTERNNKVW